MERRNEKNKKDKETKGENHGILPLFTLVVRSITIRLILSSRSITFHLAINSILDISVSIKII